MRFVRPFGFRVGFPRPDWHSRPKPCPSLRRATLLAVALKFTLPGFGFLPDYAKVRKNGLAPTYKDRHTLVVDGYERTYWRPPADPDAPSADGPQPLLLCLHGLGGTGSRLGWWSGLDRRAPEAGFLAIFPDAISQVWDDHGCGRLDGNDDYAFIVALVEHLVQSGAADPDRVFVTGVSTGATMTERLIRAGIVRARGAALVCGTARVASHDTTPIAAPRTPMLMIAGTRDPMVPYTGGNPQGVLGRRALRTVAGILTEPGGHESVGPERLAAEWAAANGCAPLPTVQAVATEPGDPTVRLVSWSPVDGDGAPVVYYRMDGGGHGWPSGKQYLPIRMIGQIPQHFDATGIVLDFAWRCIGRGPLASVN